MKNIFKFMGIALMACSLTMVSCSKDDEKSDNSNPNPNPNPNPTQSTLKIYWDGNEQNLGYTSTPYNSNYGIAMIEAAKALNGNTPEPPYFKTYYAPVTTGQLYLTELIRISETSDSTLADLGFSSEVVEEGYVTVGQSDYPDYLYFYTLNTTQFGMWDADNQTVDNSDIHIVFRNTENYIQTLQNVMAEENVTSPSQISEAGWETIYNTVLTKELNIKLTNYKFGE